jgi:hypothetical protein
MSLHVQISHYILHYGRELENSSKIYQSLLHTSRKLEQLADNELERM